MILSKERCPHCGTGIYIDAKEDQLSREDDRFYSLIWYQCPQCQKLVVYLLQKDLLHLTIYKMTLVKPRSRFLPEIPSEVPNHIAEDYREAHEVLPISPKASAALSRRCLQTVLREAGKTTARDLDKQIDEVVDKLPSQVASLVDAIRHVGNLAAHPMKSKSTGEIVEVEPEEAETNLYVLTQLFDFYYVKPAQNATFIEKLNGKLNDLGKPSLKSR